MANDSGGSSSKDIEINDYNRNGIGQIILVELKEEKNEIIETFEIEGGISTPQIKTLSDLKREQARKTNKKKHNKNNSILKNYYCVEVRTNSKTIELLCLKFGKKNKVIDINSKSIRNDFNDGLDDSIISAIKKESKENGLRKYLSNLYSYDDNIEEIDARSGWHFNDKGKLKYLYNGSVNRKTKDQKEENSLYQLSLKLLDITSKKQTIPLFSYCILALMFSLYEEAGVKPDFTLSIENKKADGIVELFASSIDPHINNSKEVYNGSTYYMLNRPWRINKEDIKNGVISGESINNTIEIETINKDCIVILSANRSNAKKIDQLRGMKQRILPIVISEKELDEQDYLVVDFYKGVSNGKTYSELLKESRKIRLIIQCFILWLENEISDNESFFKDLRNHFNFCIEKVEMENALGGFPPPIRQIKMYAWLLSAYLKYIEFGLSEGYIDRNSYELYLNDAVKFLNRNDCEEEGHLENKNPIYINKKISQNIINIVYFLYENHGYLFKNNLSFISQSDYAIAIDIVDNMNQYSDRYLGWSSTSRTQKEKIICFDKNKFLSLIEPIYRRFYDNEGDKLPDIDTLIKLLKEINVLKYEPGTKRYRRKILKKNEKREIIEMIAFRVSMIEKFAQANN